MKPLFAALLVAFPALGAAQTAQPVAPGAGVILQQIQPVTPPAPSSTGTGLTIERGDGAKLPLGAPFLVKTLQISGNTLIDTPTLHALLADAEGKNLTLSQLGELASRITGYYQSRGYPLARAIIPAQTIASGIVRIEIIEARFGQTSLNNRSQVNNSLLQATLSPLQSGQVISQTGLDRTLLLLSDIPGVLVGATLKPGQTVGTSDLLVDTTPGPAVTGNLVLDNYGNRFTGRARIGSTVNVINPLQHGDVLSVTGLSSGSGMNYGRITYESLLNGQGTRVGGSYAALRYELGEPLASLNAHGTARVGSLWAKHPLVRSRDANLYGQIQYDGKQLRDRVDTSGIRTDRHLDNWTLSLSGDALLLGGINSWNLGWTSGRVGFDNSAAQLADAATAKTQGGFSKWNANFARLQSLSPKNALYLAFSGQWASTNLDSAEKMSVGGPSTVRAYDVGALSGDTGYLATAEFRHDLDSAWNGRWQAVAFVDTARVTINKNVWVPGTNSAALSGAGVGLNWEGPNQWRAKAYIATRLGSTPTLVASSASTRTWVELSKRF
ncbi:MAG: ShlB/FhaC/HecB family hemolysin secretion/activation protein [Polaromonas sp.]|nr:ShlB/FhaC/HecB family hemolysin secretion/activation protein [Polaromonas sp.]